MEALIDERRLLAAVISTLAACGAPADDGSAEAARRADDAVVIADPITTQSPLVLADGQVFWAEPHATSALDDATGRYVVTTGSRLMAVSSRPGDAPATPRVLAEETAGAIADLATDGRSLFYTINQSRDVASAWRPDWAKVVRRDLDDGGYAVLHDEEPAPDSEWRASLTRLAVADGAVVFLRSPFRTTDTVLPHRGAIWSVDGAGASAASELFEVAARLEDLLVASDTIAWSGSTFGASGDEYDATSGAWVRPRAAGSPVAPLGADGAEAIDFILATDGTHVIWTAMGGRPLQTTVYAADLADPSRSWSLARVDGTVANLAADGRSVYYSLDPIPVSFASSLWSVPVAGGAAPRALSQGRGRITRLAVDDAAVYVSVRNPGTRTSTEQLLRHARPAN